MILKIDNYYFLFFLLMSIRLLGLGEGSQVADALADPNQDQAEWVVVRDFTEPFDLKQGLSTYYEALKSSGLLLDNKILFSGSSGPSGLLHNQGILKPHDPDHPIEKVELLHYSDSRLWLKVSFNINRDLLDIKDISYPDIRTFKEVLKTERCAEVHKYIPNVYQTLKIHFEEARARFIPFVGLFYQWKLIDDFVVDKLCEWMRLYDFRLTSRALYLNLIGLTDLDRRLQQSNKEGKTLSGFLGDYCNGQDTSFARRFNELGPVRQAKVVFGCVVLLSEHRAETNPIDPGQCYQYEALMAFLLKQVRHLKPEQAEPYLELLINSKPIRDACSNEFFPWLMTLASPDNPGYCQKLRQLIQLKAGLLNAPPSLEAAVNRDDFISALMDALIQRTPSACL